MRDLIAGKVLNILRSDERPPGVAERGRCRWGWGRGSCAVRRFASVIPRLPRLSDEEDTFE